jgi:hypothetical protein
MLEFITTDNPDIFIINVQPGVINTDILRKNAFNLDDREYKN